MTKIRNKIKKHQLMKPSLHQLMNNKYQLKLRQLMKEIN